MMDGCPQQLVTVSFADAASFNGLGIPGFAFTAKRLSCCEPTLWDGVFIVRHHLIELLLSALGWALMVDKFHIFIISYVDFLSIF